jgi:hypothetical protein
VGGLLALGVGNAVGGVGFLVGGRVGFLLGGRVGLRVGIRVGLRVGGLAPLTMTNDTRYKVSARPLTLAVIVWEPAWRLAHRLYDRPPQRV